MAKIISIMLPRIIISLLIYCSVEAQDPDCNFRQSVGQKDVYWIESPGYSANYTPGKTCRWIGQCPLGYNCRIDCTLNMPQSDSCTEDRVLVSRSGNELLINPERYCGVRNFSSLSTGRKIVVGLFVPDNSPGGRFICSLRSQRANTNPTYCQCGEKQQSKIVGGVPTGEHEYKMMAGIRDLSVGDVICGAVIVKPTWVLSAAHCFYIEGGQRRNINDIRVIVGHRDTERTTPYTVRSIVIHPNYNAETFDYDVSLIQTRIAFRFNQNVGPVCLPYRYYEDSLVGQNLTVLGWGSLGLGLPTTNILQEVDVKVVSQTECQESYNDVAITQRRLCTFAVGKDSCQMDSGGPLLITSPKSGSLFNVGIVSFGQECASDIPSVNTRVTSQLNWITRTIGSRGICVKDYP